MKHAAKTPFRSRSLIVSLLFAALLVFPCIVIPSPSDLDATFGNGGIVTSQLGVAQNRISSIQVQPDGKIVVSGYSYSMMLGRNPVIHRTLLSHDFPPRGPLILHLDTPA